MMNGTIVQRECVSAFSKRAESAGWPSTLLVSHTNGAVVSRIRIAVRRIVQVEHFLGKVQPTFLVKIFCVIFSDHLLEISLPGSDDFMQWFRCRREIVGSIHA